MKVEDQQSTTMLGLEPKGSTLKPVLSVVLTYVFFGALWIYFSDWALESVTEDTQQLARWQNFKGWAFVGVTAALLFYLLYRAISRIQQTQSFLELSETRYRNLVSKSPDALLIELDKKVAFVNPAAMRIFGASATEELQGKSIFDLVHPDEHERARQYSEEALSQGANHDLLIRKFRRLDGTLFLGEMAVGATDFHGQPALEVVIRDVTERRRTEEALLESETRLRLALEAARQGIYDLDLSTGEIITNAEYALMWGHDPAQFQESFEQWKARLHPQDRDRMLTLFQAYLEGQIPEFRVEFRHQPSNGELKWILALGKIVERDEKGKPQRMLGTITDITPQKMAQHRLQKLNRLYAALSLANEAILRVREREKLFQEISHILVKHGGIQMAWIAMLDPLKNELAPLFGAVANGDFESLPPIGLPSRQTGGEGHPALQALRQAEHFLCNDWPPDPSPFSTLEPAGPIACRAAGWFPLKQAGAVFGALCLCVEDKSFFDAETQVLLDEMALDISFALDSLDLEAQRAQALAALHQSESKYRRIVETANEGIWMLDTEERTSFVNRQMAEMLGYQPDEMINLESDNFLFVEDLSDHHHRTDARRRGMIGQYERRLCRKDGTPLWALVSVTAILDEDGNYAGSFAMFTDITQRKQAEQALHELSGRLLRAQDEEHRRIARDLHDTTSQNLAALGMNLSLIGQSLPAANSRITQMLEDCMNLADKSAQEIRTISYSLHPPILDMVGLPGALREFADGFTRHSGIQVEFEAAHDFGRLPPEVETTLFRVAQECLSNIHRHSESVTAQVRLYRQNGEVDLEIADQGRGIPEPQMKSIREGSSAPGVGIAGIRERLLQLGGYLEVRSHPGGTEVKAQIKISSENH